jgi:23S rRNA (cytidine1920-2'-O)/16S rRNA (cytidine1409-2'-O)-methyltransferase
MRIDQYLSQQFGSRNKAAAAIAKGLVQVNGKTVAASFQVDPQHDHIVVLSAQENYVSVGGFKLAKALKDFSYDVQNKIFADIGASTGGFTDCLLQNGAQKIYCIDVGESQLDVSLDKSKLVVMDNFNARNLTKEVFQDQLDGAVIDVSFISLTYILKNVADVLDEGKDIIALVKPQFECESKHVGKNGIVKGTIAHRQILQKIYDFAITCGLNPLAITNAPIVKGKNLEYLMLLRKNSQNIIPFSSLTKSLIL